MDRPVRVSPRARTAGVARPTVARRAEVMIIVNCMVERCRYEFRVSVYFCLCLGLLLMVWTEYDWPLWLRRSRGFI
jgi:hypothetical protein